MSLPQAIALGISGDKLSRTITGTDKVSAGRSAVATGAGAALGAASTGALVVGASSLGATAVAAAAAPLVVPMAVAAGAISLIASLFD